MPAAVPCVRRTLGHSYRAGSSSGRRPGMSITGLPTAAAMVSMANEQQLPNLEGAALG